MNEKKYDLPNGKTAVFCYDDTGVGRVTLEAMDALMEMIKELSSAQPEIIRCKECKYASPNGKCGCKAYHFKLYETHEMEEDDFCSRAERRE